MTLQIGQLTDAVTRDAPMRRCCKRSNAEIAEVIDNRQVEQLPLNGRQFIQLAQLTDGVTIPPGGTRGAALGQAGPLPNVYGQRGGHNIYLIDGVKVTDEYFNNLVISPSVDAIQEFKIQKTMYPAEFGGKASALINVVTKSGGNRFHGSALEFARNEAFDAHNYFDDPDQADPAARPEPVRRQRRRPARSRIRRSSSSATKGSGSAGRRRRPFRCRPRRCAAAISRALAALCDPLTRTAAGACTPFAGNQIPAEPHQPGRAGAAGRGAAADERRPGAEPARGRRRSQPDEPVQPQARPSPRRERQPVRPVVRPSGCDDTQPFGTTVVERGAGARFRPNGDHPQRERGARLHPRLRLQLAERSPLRLSQRPRRTGESQSGRRLRGARPAFRA